MHYLEREKRCDECGELFWSPRPKRFCSPRCNRRHWHAENRVRWRSRMDLLGLCGELHDRSTRGEACIKQLPRLFRLCGLELRRRGLDPYSLLLSLPAEPAPAADCSAGGTDARPPRWQHPPERALELLSEEIERREGTGDRAEWHRERRAQLERYLHQTTQAPSPDVAKAKRARTSAPPSSGDSEQEKRCYECGERFRSPRPRRFCSSRCKLRDWRAENRRSPWNQELLRLCGELHQRPMSSETWSTTLPRLFQLCTLELRRREMDPYSLLWSLPDEPAHPTDQSAGGVVGTPPERTRWLHPPEQEFALLSEEIERRKRSGHSAEWHQARRAELAHSLLQTMQALSAVSDEA